MEQNFALSMQRARLEAARVEWEKCNEISAPFGLVLRPDEIEEIAQGRLRSLRASGRVEFGEGVARDLVYAFCDSPYLDAGNYARTLCDLQELFYALKTESGDALTDDELIACMRARFDDPCGGSVERLADLTLGDLLSGRGKEF